MVENFPSGTVAGTRRSASGLSPIRRSFPPTDKNGTFCKQVGPAMVIKPKEVARKANRKVFILKD